MLPAWIIDFFQPQGVKCLRCGMAYFDELNAGLCPMCALHVSRMEPADMPAWLSGFPGALITAGLMAMAFLGFNGMIR